MPGITLSDLARARYFVSNIEARLKGAGVKSSTLTELTTRLDVLAGSLGLPTLEPTIDPENPMASIQPRSTANDGIVSVPPTDLAQLQSLASRLEMVVYQTGSPYIVQPELSQLRYLLSEEVR